MTTKLYNPKTGEAIFSDNAAPWMGVAHEDAPEHDRQTASAFYVDGAWSVVAYSPDPTARIAEIDSRLAQIDSEAIRPLRAIQAGTATQFDHEKLLSLDTEADLLRQERAGL